jgi:hypothetical protein
VTEQEIDQLDYLERDEAGRLVPLVPAGADLTDDLTVDELSTVSKSLRCDVGAALSDTGTGVGRRWDAMALLAHTWAKRSHPRAKLTPFRQLRGSELVTLLGWDADLEAADDTDADGEVAADPTAPAHVS